MSEIINETINELNKPTQNNIFSIEDDPVTVLEKINQVERYLKQIDTRVDTSINTANEALEKANNAFEANGTLVKINGENQLTWSADFAESERQKSQTDGAIVHEKDIEPILIYDKDTKNTIGGTAYTGGIPTDAVINHDFSPYKKLILTAFRDNVGPFDYEINLEYLDYTGVYCGSGITYSFQANDNYFVYSSAKISDDKQTMTYIKSGYTETFFETIVSQNVPILRIKGVK